MKQQDGKAGNRNSAKRVTLTTPGPWLSWRTTDRAERCIRFIEEFCVIPKGYGAGQKLKLAKFQKEWIRSVLAPGVRTAALSLPRGNGKSSLLAAIAVWAVFDKHESGAPQVPIIAVTVGQAKRATYAVAVAFIEANPELKGRSIKYSGIGDTRIVVPANGNGELFPVAAEPASLQGLDPGPLAIADEMGFLEQESFDALTLASGKRPNSLVVGIGTPGFTRTNALWNLRQVVRDGGNISGLVYTEYAATPDCDIRDENEWMKANPALAEGFMDIEALRSAVETSPSAAFRMFRLGQYVDGADSWLGENGYEVWKGLEDHYEFVDGAPTWIGIDVGLKRDSTAVVAVQFRPDGRLHAQCRIFMPAKDDPVDILQVMEHVRSLCRDYKVGAVAYDPRFLDLTAAYLYKEGLPMVEIPQSVERMSSIIGNLYETIKRGELSHSRDETFAQQVLNAVPRVNERGFTLMKNKSRGRIDAAIALSLAVDRAQHKQEPRPKVVVL